MASAILISKSLVLRYKVGIDKDGKDIKKNLRLSKIKGNATPDDLYETGVIIGELLDCISYELSEELSNQIIG